MKIPDAEVAVNEEWKEVIKEAHNNSKESPLCYIDGHPPHSEVQVHPGECSKEQSQV